MKYIYFIVIITIIIFFLSINKIVEGDVSLPSGQNQASVGSLKDLRTFLEQMYMISTLNENDITTDGVQQSACYKISILGTFIPSVLGNLASTDMQTLQSIYGDQTTQPLMAGMPNPTVSPPIPPVINGNQDYIMFLTLCTYGNLLSVYNALGIWVRYPGSDNNKVVAELCTAPTGDQVYLLQSARNMLNIIKQCLAYFHNQSMPNQSSPGDAYDTMP